jgi:predicted ATPase
MALLQPVYDRFTEGFETADLKAAKMLLEALAEHASPRVSQD